MEYTVSSLKEAIDITIEHIGYDKDDISIIRKLIHKALEMDSKPFTRTAGAREYIKNAIINNSIINELREKTNTISQDINEVIEIYIDKFFRKKVYNYEQEKNEIKENTSLDKVERKIKFINTSSIDDQDFLTNRWNIFTNIFSGNDSTMSAEELKYNMIYIALEQAEIHRDKATILKQIDPLSKELTKMDAIKIVEEYIYNQKTNELIELINNNPILSGLLLQNLFDYIDEEKIDKFSLYELDNELEKIPDLKTRSNILLQVLNGEEILNLDREKVIINILKNTLALSMYTNNKPYIDYEERRLYTGMSNETEEQVIQNRIMTNNQFSNNLVINGKNTTNEELINFINNISEKEKYFLANIFVLSRSTQENKNKLDNSIYYGTNEQIYVYGLLEKEKLIQELKQQKQNTL
ncbi:MAG: hypothetical protein E7157_02080 [Lactobacillales bacterium]|nr:hypothetical protein [Lactobacillales bacterium]